MLDRRDIPLSALRAFESAGIYGHLGRAGEALGVTHGAISHQIRSLETKLNVQLFTRRHNRLQLTSAGERLLHAVSEGFDRIVDGTLHLDPDSLAGVLLIGCTQTIGTSWAVKHIGQFQAKYPQIEIRMLEIQPRQKAIPNEIDVAICYGEPAAGRGRISLLYAPPLFPVCSPRLLHGRTSINRSEQVGEMPLLHDAQNSWARWFNAMGATQPQATRHLRFYNTSLCLSAARSGCGVALANELEVEEDMREGRLIKLLNQTMPESNSYYLYSSFPNQQPLRARLFDEWIRAAIFPYISKT